MRRAFLLVALTACTGGTTPVPQAPETDVPQVEVRPALPMPVVFDALQLPETGKLDSVLSTTGASVAGERIAVTWHPLLRQGQTLSGRSYGVLVDETGADIRDDGMCPHADFGGLVEAHGKLWHLGHIECMPGALWLSELRQDDSGMLQPVSTRPVDLSGVHGGKHFCAGVTTPWGSVLSGEEYDVDARKVQPDGRLDEGWTYDDYDPQAMARYYADPNRLPYPYDHGWITETRILDAQGTTEVVKHYAMGRFSHEIGYLMPDDRTVYLTDDNVNGGFFLFVADREGDLSAGTLYAARWSQTSAEGGGSGDLSWVSLGHATDEQVGAAIAAGALHYDELIEDRVLLEITEEDTDAPPPCPEGYQTINDAWGAQCLQIREGVDPAVVSRLETRRFAALKGATVEFRKTEGVAHDPDHDVLYVALAEVNKGMIGGSPQWDKHGPDHIQVVENRCGGVYALPLTRGIADTDGNVIDSPYVATSMQGFILGRPEGFGCAQDVPANPDNLAYLPGSGRLFIAEDTGYHRNNLLWSVDVAALHAGGLASLEPIFAVPPGAEVTGTRWYPDLGGHGYLTVTVQHPWQGTAAEASKPVEERMGTFGYFGPFPKLRP